ncbi:hypothetical protein QAD02_016742 [Eretmocerus hayati]|uniref:Uncharacterized protein n=1 Tax=Eretmocerus hayati TaxID=131215 RepID=A0ACC2PGR4_9HYME|nr:hypothetical protein QAD02_016742 [Eretmocerus hayati]
MATATMGLRRRVHQVTSTSSTSTSNGGKRGRSSENNNSPSQGNLNSLESPAKKSRTATLRSRTKELEMQQKKGPPHWSDPRPYASIAGLSLEAQAALCSENGGLPSPMSYIDRLTSSSSMATFVGNGAAGGSPISYLDISNMTTGPRSGWPAEAFGPFGTHPACTVTSAAHAAAAAAAAAVMASSSTSSSTTSTTSGSSDMTVQSHENQKQEQQQQVSMNFPNDAMFGAYQPWVIKTYGDLAKTKTITIKKYARILRTLRGEEVNSAENSKFRFWVKSKGFHVGQPEGYEAKPADRIIGRHAVTSPGLDPPLYVPTQPPHNKVSVVTNLIVVIRIFPDLIAPHVGLPKALLILDI